MNRRSAALLLPALRRGALLLSVLLRASPALAEDGPLLTGTLKAVHDRGTILLGTRDGAVPFAFQNRAGQPIGFSVDLCHGIAEDVAAALGQDLLEPDAPAWQRGIRIAYIPVMANARLPMVVSGAIDLECGSTTANADRSQTVAFSPVFFLAGTKLLVPVGIAATSYRGLAGKTVAVGAGTTNAVVIHRLATSVSPPIQVVEFPSVEAGFTALAAGQADALASDDILLIAMALAHDAGDRFQVIGDYLSFEPYALMFRRNDPAFAALVQQSFGRMATDGTLRAHYDRWFADRLPNGVALDLPISPQLDEMYRAMGQSD